MAAYSIFLFVMVSILISCNGKGEDKELEIYHLKPNDIIDRENEEQGWYTKERHDFFAIKNFDVSNELHKLKVDRFVLNYIKNDDFLEKNDNASWSLVFYKYGDGIDENTMHEYDTDYTIHTLFAFEKRQIYYSFNSKDKYDDTSYYLEKGDSIIHIKRELINLHYINKSHLKD